jgi:hypothetical protein
MTRPRATAFEQELERRLALLSREAETDRRLPRGDRLVLAAFTFGSFAAVLIVQAF